MNYSIGSDGWRSNVVLFACLFVLFSLLVVDGYPAGALALREFGARPANFLLGVAMFALIAGQLLSGTQFTFSRRELLFALVILLGIPALNLPVAILLQQDTPIDSLVIDWSKQYGMLLWGLTSYMIWRRLLRSLSPEQITRLMCLGTILPLIGFYGDLVGSAPIQSALGIFRAQDFTRPSGFATEPALYASWLAFVWPLVFYYAIRARAFASRVFGMFLFAALCASAVLCRARTIAVIVMLQILYYGFWAIRRTRGLRKLRALVFVSFFAVAVVGVFAATLSTLTEDSGSNISRIGSTVTGVRVSLAYPIFGVGIGQFKYFFGAYAPDFALANSEILNHAAGLSDYRASTFNLFVRFFCEFGFPIGLWFSILVLRPIVSAARLRYAGDVLVYGTLAAIGGVGFWLSQEQYGYQPGILSLAILSHFLSARPSPRSAP